MATKIRAPKENGNAPRGSRHAVAPPYLGAVSVSEAWFTKTPLDSSQQTARSQNTVVRRAGCDEWDVTNAHLARILSPSASPAGESFPLPTPTAATEKPRQINR